MTPTFRSRPGTFLVTLFFVLAPVTTALAEPAPDDLAKLSMDAMGSRAALDSARLLRFDWAVERDGQTVASYAHLWDRETGRYRVEGVNRAGESLRAVFPIHDHSAGVVYRDGNLVEGEEVEALLDWAYGRFINDSYWLLMPWKWLDDGVSLATEGEREHEGRSYRVVRLTFDDGTGLTSGDRYWGWLDAETGRMARWQYVLQNEAGEPGEGEPTTWTWADWQTTAAGVELSARKTREGPEGEPAVAITCPTLAMTSDVAPERLDAYFSTATPTPMAEIDDELSVWRAGSD